MGSTASNTQKSFSEDKLLHLKALRRKSDRSPAENRRLERLEIEKFEYITSRALEESSKARGVKVSSSQQLDLFSKHDEVEFDTISMKFVKGVSMTAEEHRLLDYYAKMWLFRSCLVAKLDYWEFEGDVVEENTSTDDTDRLGTEDLFEPRLTGVHLPNGAYLHLRGNQLSI